MPTKVKRIPKYLQLKRQILAMMEEGSVAEGTKLPTVRQWMEKYDVSLSTVTRALDELDKDGRIVLRHGSGVYVRSLRTETTRASASSLVGLLVPQMARGVHYSNEAHYAIMRAAETVLSRDGYGLVLGFYEVSTEDEKRQMRLMTERGVAGLIIYPSYTSPGNDYYRTLQAMGLPTVLVDSALEGLELDSVQTDGEASSRQGADALAKTGCRCVGFLSGHLNDPTSHDRLRGCEAGLAASGVPLEEDRIRAGDYTPEFGYSATNELLDAHPEMDGLFIANEPITLGAVEALQERRSDLIEQGRVCSFYEPNPFTERFLPLILLKQPREATGRVAASMLLERIAEHREHRTPLAARSVRLRASMTLPSVRRAEETETAGMAALNV